MSRILVIDDEEEIRTLLKETLERAGYEVEVAIDGRRGLEQLRRRLPALVITDIFMPDKDGIETILDLQQEFPAVKIIAMSGGGTLHTLDYLTTARDMGAVRTIAKPFDCDEILNVVRGLLTTHEPRS